MQHYTTARLDPANEKAQMLEEKRLNDCVNIKQNELEQQAKTERVRLQFEESGKAREHEERIKRQEQEHEKEMTRFQMEERREVREHELSLMREKQKEIKLELELAKAKQAFENQKLQKLNLQVADNRHEREHKERMAAFAVEKLKSAEEIRRHRLEERTVTEEMKQKINNLDNRCEELEVQRCQKDEDDIRFLTNVGLAAAGVEVGEASGAMRTPDITTTPEPHSYTNSDITQSEI